jgi:hypothetical protein
MATHAGWLDLQVWLADRGHQYIASGCFSAVTTFGRSKVLKISRAYAADGWETFARAAQSSPCCHFPRIRRIGRVQSGNESYLFVVMERLYCTLADARHFPGRFPLPLKRSDLELLSDLCRHYRRDAAGWSEHLEGSRLSTWPQLAKAAHQLHCLAFLRFEIDFHARNVMFRQNGDLVFSDPLGSAVQDMGAGIVRASPPLMDPGPKM